MTEFRNDWNGVASNSFGLTALKKHFTTCFKQLKSFLKQQQKYQHIKYKQLFNNDYEECAFTNKTQKNFSNFNNEIKQIFKAEFSEPKQNIKNLCDSIESSNFVAKLLSSTLISETPTRTRIPNSTSTPTTTTTTTTITATSIGYATTLEANRLELKANSKMTIVDNTFVQIRDEYPSLNAEIRAILLSFAKTGATISEIRNEYRKNTGLKFPVYENVIEFLLSIPEVSAVCSQRGTIIFNVVPNDKIRHLYDLVRNQKTPHEMNYNYNNNNNNNNHHQKHKSKNLRNLPRTGTRGSQRFQPYSFQPKSSYQNQDYLCNANEDISDNSKNNYNNNNSDGCNEICHVHHKQQDPLVKSPKNSTCSIPQHNDNNNYNTNTHTNNNNTHANTYTNKENNTNFDNKNTIHINNNNDCADLNDNFQDDNNSWQDDNNSWQDDNSWCDDHVLYNNKNNWHNRNSCNNTNTNTNTNTSNPNSNNNNNTNNKTNNTNNNNINPHKNTNNNPNYNNNNNSNNNMSFIEFEDQYLHEPHFEHLNNNCKDNSNNCNMDFECHIPDHYPTPYQNSNDEHTEPHVVCEENNNFYADNCNYFYNRLRNHKKNTLQNQFMQQKNLKKSFTKTYRNLIDQFNDLHLIDEPKNNEFWKKPNRKKRNKYRQDERNSLATVITQTTTTTKTSTQDDSYLSLRSEYNAHLLDFPLLGDDFFLYLARMELKCKFVPHQKILQSGFCISGQTIRAAIKRIKSQSSNRGPQKRVIINIGSVDIMQGRSLVQIEHDFRELIDIMHRKNMKPIVTTLAPLANAAYIPEIKEKLERFNEFIKREARYLQCIDIWSCLVNEKRQTLFDCFQKEPRKVTGAKEYYVFWNKIGRQRVLQNIESALEY